MALLFDGLVISPQIVTPAKAGVQKTLERLDSRLRGNDRKGRFPTSYESIKFDGLVKSPLLVTPAKAGVQKRLKRLDSRLRGNDRKERFPTSYESIKFPVLFLNLFRSLMFLSFVFVSNFGFRASACPGAT